MPLTSIRSWLSGAKITQSNERSDHVVRDIALVAACGALATWPLTRPTFWLLAIACTAVLYDCCSRTTPEQCARLGWIFGGTYTAASVWWLFVSMREHIGVPWLIAAALVVTLSVFMGSILAAALFLFSKLRRDRPAFDAILFASCWMLGELVRSTLFTGFPWGISGYAHIEGPLAVAAPWVGVFGVGFLASWAAAAIASALGSAGRRSYAPLLSVVTVLLILHGALPKQFTATNGRLSVALLQTNVTDDAAFNGPRFFQEPAWASMQLTASRADLSVTPEAIMLTAERSWENFPYETTRIADRFRRGEQAALVGVLLQDPMRRLSNSVVGLSSAGVYRYDKRHLVPFGESIPLNLKWLLVGKMHLRLSDFKRGTEVAKPFFVKGQRVLPHICFESMFGDELAEPFRDETTAPTVLAHLGDMVWFGQTIALDQELNASRMRSLELQRPMLRADNAGVTAIIDHLGHVTASIPPYTTAVLLGEVEGRTGLTPYARWASLYGNAPLWLFAGLPLLASIRRPLGKIAPVSIAYLMGESSLNSQVQRGRKRSDARLKMPLVEERSTVSASMKFKRKHKKRRP
ncbi:MAG: apolipoprotein N-acyltransferase [Caldimonas sp.]